MKKNKGRRLLFYQNNHLYLELIGSESHILLRHQNRVHAQQQPGEGLATLFATDLSGSILSVQTHNTHDLSYSPYGYSPLTNRLLPGFNGERRDRLADGYLLGNGYRAYSPSLMRFRSPDSWSPFFRGGINSYAYCLGNPVNNGDPSGHIPLSSALCWKYDMNYRRTRFQPKISKTLDTLPPPITHTKRNSAPAITSAPARTDTSPTRQRSNSWTYTEPLFIRDDGQVEQRWKYISLPPLQERTWRDTYDGWAFHAKWAEYPTDTYRYQEWRNNQIRIRDLGDDILLLHEIGQLPWSQQVADIRRYQFEIRNRVNRMFDREKSRLRR
ncbi:RHS repeat-associated core domain-containing protein [Pseudomonas sp. HLMP]|uniref:RHS repeat-associated core domain-containing protein n=1 Tax=Pseudomonas sp. HLMP TaxID=3153767 RepID=UPI003967C98C